MTTPATTGLREWLREMSREAEAAAKGARTNAEAQWHLGQQHMADAVLTRLATDTVVERNDSPERDIEPAYANDEGYVVDYCHTHDQPADQCATTPVAVVSSSLDVELFFEPCRDFAAPASCYTNDGTGLWCDPCLARRDLLLAHNADTDTGGTGR